jgi:hypothetical protein
VIVAMVGMALFTVPAALVPSNVVALACISVVIFLANAASACSWALATVAAPPNRVASLSRKKHKPLPGSSQQPRYANACRHECVAPISVSRTSQSNPPPLSPPYSTFRTASSEAHIPNTCSCSWRTNIVCWASVRTRWTLHPRSHSTAAITVPRS